MALVVVLSVFNGLEGVIREMFGTYDPEIKIVPSKGKSFQYTDSWLDSLKTIDGIETLSLIAEDNALVKFQQAQVYCKIKGVSDNFDQQNNFKATIVQGQYKLYDQEAPQATIGRGIQYQLSAHTIDGFFMMQCWYPKNRKKISLNPTNAFNVKPIRIAAVFAIEKSVDETYIFVPLQFAQDLFEWNQKASSLEVRCTHPNKVSQVQNLLKDRLGEKFKVLNSDEQHAGLIRAIRIERLFVFFTFAFVLAIASINIFFSLYMLILEKRPDMALLKSMGARNSQVSGIFITEGVIIGSIGAIIGLGLGFLLCWGQQQFGWVSMGMQTSLIDAYPIVMQARDFVLSALTILVITLLAAIVPATKAAQTPVKEFVR